MSNSGESGLAGGLESDYSGGEGVGVGLLRAFRWAQRMPRLVGPGRGEGLGLEDGGCLSGVLIDQNPESVHEGERVGFGVASHLHLVSVIPDRYVVHLRTVAELACLHFDVHHVPNLLLKFRSVTSIIIARCKQMSSEVVRIFGNLAEIFQLDTWRARMEAGA